MIYIIIILVIVGLLIFIPISAGIKDAKAKETTNFEMREYESLSISEQERLYRELIKKTSSYAEKKGKNELAKKIRDEKFDYRNLKYFEIRNLK